MKALIHNEKVIQVTDKEFPVSPSLKWVDCPEDVTTRHEYKAGKFVSPEVEPKIEPDETEALIRREMREMAIESLKSKGKI
jgi:hypothetical protein